MIPFTVEIRILHINTLQELSLLRRILSLMVIIVILSTIPGSGTEGIGGDASTSLPFDDPSDSFTGISTEPPPALISEPAIQPAPEMQDFHEQNAEAPAESDCSIPALTVQGDWAGYVYGVYSESWEDDIEFVMLLRMQDEERGLLGFCAVMHDEDSRNMSDKGSGCASVCVSFISDNEIQIKVDNWFYRKKYNELNVFPQDFTICLNYYRAPGDTKDIDYEDPFYKMTPVPGYNNSSPDVIAGVSESGELFCFARISEEENLFPAWYHQYDGLNGCLEGVFGFGECGGDNINTSNVFVFPLDDGSFRLRYIYTEFGYPIMGDNGEWGIPEYTIDHDVGELSRMSTEYWVCVWYPGDDAKVVIASKRFTSFYKDWYIPDLVRVAQAKDWEDGFESVSMAIWPEDRYWDYLKIIMCKKLIYAAQEVIAGRFDGNPDKIYDFVEARYKPNTVKLDHYNPESDPNAYILRADLDMDGEEEVLIIRAYRRDGDEDKPLDSAQLIINGEVYFGLYGETVQPKIFTVDLNNNDNTIEFAIVFTQNNSCSFIRIFRYTSSWVTELTGIWGKLDNEFDGIGRIAEFPGDGSIVTYVPGDDGYKREVVYPDEQNESWLGSTRFY